MLTNLLPRLHHLARRVLAAARSQVACWLQPVPVLATQLIRDEPAAVRALTSASRPASCE